MSEDLTGQQFGPWLVLRKEPTKRHAWAAQCRCGNIRIQLAGHIKQQRVATGCSKCAWPQLAHKRERSIQQAKEKAAAIKLSGVKPCTKCRLLLPTHEFAESTSRTDRLQTKCRLCAYLAHIKSRYGLLPAEYHAMVASQKGKCKIPSCDNELAVVDHCHKTGAVRGLLCRGCNSILTEGMSAAKLDELKDYLLNQGNVSLETGDC